MSFLLRSRLADSDPTMTAMVATENSTMSLSCNRGAPSPARAPAASAPTRSLDCSVVHRPFHPDRSDPQTARGWTWRNTLFQPPAWTCSSQRARPEE